VRSFLLTTLIKPLSELEKESRLTVSEEGCCRGSGCAEGGTAGVGWDVPEGPGCERSIAGMPVSWCWVLVDRVLRVDLG
jgi:hypothetical protein